MKKKKSTTQIWGIEKTIIKKNESFERVQNENINISSEKKFQGKVITISLKKSLKPISNTHI